NVGLGRNTFVADIDIVIACAQIRTGTTAQGDIAAAGFVAKERSLAIGRVVAASRVAIKRCLTGGRVEAASCVVIEGFKTDVRVVEAAGETEAGVSSLSRVLAGIASVRCWRNPESIRGWRKRKADEHQ